MDDNAASTRSRRRKAVAAVTVISDDEAPEASSSTSKQNARSKRDRRPSLTKEATTPSQLEDQRQKGRTRRSPGKDAPPSAKQNASSNAASAPGEVQPPDASRDAGEDSGDSDGDPIDVVPVSTLRKAHAPASSRQKAQPKASAPSSASKETTDLARQLFDDDDDDADGNGNGQGIKESEQQPADAAKAAATSASPEDAAKSSASSRKRSRVDSNASRSDPNDQAERYNATDSASLQLRIRQLELQLAETKAQASQDAGIITQQNTIFKELHSQCICHICLEPSFRPCVLAPCGHVFCIHCLRSWFTKPRESESAPPSAWSQARIDEHLRMRTLKRRKICPSCRTELACPPVEVFLVRDMLEKVDEGLKLSKEARLDSEVAESSNAILSVDDRVRLKGEDLPKGAKLWADIFDEDGPRRIIYDEVDGVPRCGSCGCEIFDGLCSNPSCEIDYDSLSEYDDWRMPREGMDSDMDSEHEFGYHDRDGPRRNGALATRLAEFEARHGRSEDMRDTAGAAHSDGGGSEHTQIEYLRESDLGEHDEEDEDEEMDDFIVRDEYASEYDEDDDDDEDRDGYGLQHPLESLMHGPIEWNDSASDEDWEVREEAEDDFLPGPRRIGRASAIEISDDEGSDGDTAMGRGSSVEYAGRGAGRMARGRGRAMDSEDEDDEDEDAEVREVRHEAAGSSNDSSMRRRRARIVDDEDEDDDEADEQDVGL